MTTKTLLPLVLVAALASTGCNRFLRGLSEEASASAEAALTACADEDIDAFWAMTGEGFRENAPLEDVPEICENLVLRLGSFEGISKVSSVNRQAITEYGDVMALSVTTRFDVGEVEGTIEMVRSDGEWTLLGWNLDVDDAPRLPPDDEALVASASAARDLVVAGDIDAFHDEMALALQEQMPLERLHTAWEEMVAAHGLVTAAGAPTQTETDAGERAIDYPLVFGTGEGLLSLRYEWIGARWALLSFNLRPPQPAAGNGSGKPPR